MRAEQPLWRRWLLPVCLALVVVNLIGLAAWTWPRRVSQGEAESRAQQARAELARRRELVGRLRERSEAIRANATDRDRFFRQAGTEEIDLVPLHEAVQEMARAVGLRPGARQVSHDEIDGVPLERVTFRLPLEGSYQQLVGFLGQVERSPRFLVVERISMSGEPGSAKLQVELSTFLRAPGLEGGARRTRGR